MEHVTIYKVGDLFTDQIHHTLLGPVQLRRTYVSARRQPGTGRWLQLGQFAPNQYGKALESLAFATGFDAVLLCRRFGVYQVIATREADR